VNREGCGVFLYDLDGMPALEWSGLAWLFLLSALESYGWLMYEWRLGLRAPLLVLPYHRCTVQ
jgi:hypothetical protein